MTVWFGKSWGASCCDPAEHVDTPVGKTCVECTTPIVDGDQGFLLSGATSTVGYHRVCFLRTVIPCGMWTDEMLRDMPEWWAVHRSERHPALEPRER